MKISKCSLFLTACLSFTMSACQTVGDVGVASEGASTQELNIAQRLGTAAPGTPVSLVGKFDETTQTVTVGEVYTAASGRECKRLFSLDAQPLNQVVCLNKSGVWILQGSLSVKTASYSVIPDTFSDAELVQPVIEVQASYTSSIEEQDVLQASKIGENASGKRTLGTTEILREGSETLWSFSQRVTGNGEHWQKLAELNDIENAWEMSEMQSLQVPLSLLSTIYATQSAGVKKVEQK